MIGAWLRIAAVDALVAIFGFARLHRFVRGIPVRRARDPRTAEEICAVVRRAAVYYPRELHCLRRSAAQTWLLRSRGHAAELIIGACVTPFLAHAWVEVGGRVVNDDEPVIRATYAVLERC